MRFDGVSSTRVEGTPTGCCPQVPSWQDAAEATSRVPRRGEPRGDRAAFASRRGRVSAHLRPSGDACVARAGSWGAPRPSVAVDAEAAGEGQDALRARLGLAPVGDEAAPLPPRAAPHGGLEGYLRVHQARPRSGARCGAGAAAARGGGPARPDHLGAPADATTGGADGSLMLAFLLPLGRRGPPTGRCWALDWAPPETSSQDALSLALGRAESSTESYASGPRPR